MNNQADLLVVSSSPHIHSGNSIPQAMRDVLIALVPALLLALYFFGLSAAAVVIASVAAALVSEAITQKLMHKEITIKDGSAAVTGLLLAFCLPPSISPLIAAIGAGVAIVFVKQFFGGLGCNIFNPALIGRAFLMAAWPAAMTTWVSPIDGVTTATPLGIVKEGLEQQLPGLGQLFIGNVGGSLGETSALALLLGGLYLIYRKQVDWRVPASYIGTVFVLTAIIGGLQGKGIVYPFFHILSGGLFLGAFFMATDWVTGPVTKLGRLVFGIGCGCLTVLIRLKGGYPEGVCYSILLMNTLTPLIDRYTRARVYGRVKKHA